MISEDPGAASQIVLDLCTVVQGPAPWLYSTGTRRLVDRLVKCSRAFCQKYFEVEFPNAIDVVGTAPFGEMYRIFDRMSELAPLGLAPSTFEPCEHQDIHLDGIFATLVLVCEACYVYHPCSDL